MRQSRKGIVAAQQAAMVATNGNRRRRPDSSAINIFEEATAPIAEAMCWTTDWSDMKPARSAGGGTREDSADIGNMRKAPESMKPTKITTTGIATTGWIIPNQSTATCNTAPTSATRTAP